MRTLFASSLLLFAAACVAAQDNPTTVHDLRVLGMRLEPPEVLMTGCNVQLLLGLAGAASSPSGLLIGDPAECCFGRHRWTLTVVP